MVRMSRENVIYDGCYAHIISRSIRKMELFKDDEDFEEFYALLRYVKSQYLFKIYHHCLMRTHFHLVVSIPKKEDFSRAMGYIKSQFSNKFHTKYRLSGSIQEKYEDQERFFEKGRGIGSAFIRYKFYEKFK